MSTIFISGDSVNLCILEEWALDGSYVHWLNDPEICQFNSHHVFPNEKSRMHDFIKSLEMNRSQIVLAICLKDSGLHVGNISLQGIDLITRCAEFAIILGERSSWGKGIASEASRLLLNHGFMELGLNRIHCGTSDKNVGMQKLAEALGMKLEGRRREALFKHGEFNDILEYGILKSEYFDIKGK